MLTREVEKLYREYYGFQLEVPYTQQHLYHFSINQNLEELNKVYKSLRDEKVNVFVEIGGASGGSLWMYANLLCEKGAEIVVIEPERRRELCFICNKLSQLGYKVKQIHQNSMMALASVSNEIDLLHIDGDHDEISVLNDFSFYFPKVEYGGYAILHDTDSFAGPKKLRESLETQNEDIVTYSCGDFFEFTKSNLVSGSKQCQCGTSVIRRRELGQQTTNSI